MLAQGASEIGDGALSEQLRVDVEQDDDRVVVRLAGELEAATAPEFWSLLDEVPCGAGTELDLSDLRFIDSTGIGCLLRLQQRVADAGGLLVARGAHGPVRRSLEVTQLHRVIALLD